MANYNKAFNFKNGVQVDVDKFIVRGSLVGIGTSIPGELFDVNGNVRVAGLVTTRDMNVTGIATFNQIRVGAIQLSAAAGVITATAFYGDGATLSNLPTSQWVDVDVGLGFTSIYAAGNVGVATNDPRFSLQIGANPLSPSGSFSPYNLPGVGINSNGNIITTGIISALSFVGAGFGITSLNADNIQTGNIAVSLIPQLTNDKLPTNVQVGIVTATNNIRVGVLTATNIQAGIITATNRFFGDLTGYATTARSLEGNINILVGFVTTVNLDVGIISAQNLTTYNTFGVGVGSTVFYAVHSGKVGIGSTNPAGTVDINSRLNTTLNVISRGNESKIAIGQSNSSGINVGLLRYGNPAREFDIVNKSPGSINFILHEGPAGVGTGPFIWRYGQTSQDLMALTCDGNLGLGITNPTKKLEVVGMSTFSDLAYFSNGVTIDGPLNASQLNLGSFLTENLNVTSGISTFNNVNVTNELYSFGIGIQTNSLYPNYRVDGRSVGALFGRVGIGTTINTVAGGTVDAKFQLVGASAIYGGIGIGTITAPSQSTDQINIYNTNINLYSSGYTGDPNGGILFFAQDTNIVLDLYSSLGIGTDNVQSAFDLSDVGRGNPSQAFMILPKRSPTQRNSFSPLISGSQIYNTTNNAVQIYNGSSWQTLTHTDGNSANAGFSTFARWAGISTIASVAGFATVSTRSGVSTLATYSYSAGFSTVTAQAGISTSVVGGVANVTSLRVSPGISTVGVLTATGTITDSIGNVRSYPQNSQSTLVSAYTLVASDAGKHVYVTNTLNGVIVPSGVFTVGDQVLIVNGTNGTMNVDNSGGGGATVRLAGSTATTPHVMPAYGVGMLLCVASDTFILHGTGIV